MGRPFWSVVLAEKAKKREVEERKEKEGDESSENAWGSSRQDRTGLWGTSDAGLWSDRGWTHSGSSWHDTNVSSWGNDGEAIENVWTRMTTPQSNSNASESPAGGLRSDEEVPTRQLSHLSRSPRRSSRSQSPRCSQSPRASLHLSLSPRRS
ncbi:hypothetical protein BT96DRAFT_1005357 [Gymnopus androsaceus JB14]|uniref:Uncharacterized protein n=1 Tax=Gymnopus androsaceus JB14 TaxID=1447944 RepID=A0A6A4GN75_9AGAR|nr:hypothetical protein BT96DRAFT_1005357 [Gymnopus androsaceus JB14]